MTERNPSSRRANEPGTVEYSTHLPVVIQIKVILDNKRRSSALCCKTKRDRFLRNDKSRRSRKLESPSLVSEYTSGSGIRSGRAMRHETVNRHRTHREKQSTPSDHSHSEKWRIFDRTPYKKRNAFAWDKRDSATTGFTSSDDSVCQCDKVSSFKVVESSTERRLNGTTSRIHQYVKREDVNNVPSDKQQSNSHSGELNILAVKMLTLIP